ncbi:hypothetical protein ACFLYY_00765 [Patescibacteria group bacterium]
MKQILKKYWWVIIIILILAGCFYWFQWRPIQIRKECVIEVQKLIKDEVGFSSSDILFLYDFCIYKSGLAK